MIINFKFILESIPALIKAIPVTLLMAFAAAIIGWVIGLGIALIRRNKVPVISQFFEVYVSFLRGVPMIILLYISYYALPTAIYSYGLSIGREINVDAVPAVVYAIIALVLEQSAYASEIFRSAISSIDEGQFEACYSIGMTKSQALIRIVLPQAFAIAMPNLSGLFIGLVKGTSLAYYVGVYEVTATANLLANPALNFVEAYIMTTIIYELISLVFNKIFRVLEDNLKKFRAVAA